MQLNLARKWRSKYFDEVVGQSLVVRLVKNSLYRNLIFPVYLLSGTRGCGKTSIARIFAAALNCHKLEEFRANPHIQIPCLSCESCRAMREMRHPDFIEIDAASHTGVDNVRTIIEAASYVPVLGTKKIYLIDEAHMLSKAAFNAFLKILEEPPASVVFMLATTDPHKIIETVTSRCFQLFFEPIKIEEIVQHLAFVCAQEHIAVELEALELIARQTGGSMRDALNLLERVRIAADSNASNSGPEIKTENRRGSDCIITKQLVTELLGEIDDERLYEMFGVVLQGTSQQILETYNRLEIARFNPVMVWKKCVELLRQSMWIKNGVEPDGIVSPRLKECVASCSQAKLLQAFELFYAYELSFAKTTTPEILLEMLFLKVAQVKTSVSESQNGRLHDKNEALYGHSNNNSFSNPSQQKMNSQDRTAFSQNVAHTDVSASGIVIDTITKEQSPTSVQGLQAKDIKSTKKDALAVALQYVNNQPPEFNNSHSIVENTDYLPKAANLLIDKSADNPVVLLADLPTVIENDLPANLSTDESVVVSDEALAKTEAFAKTKALAKTEAIAQAETLTDSGTLAQAGVSPNSGINDKQNHSESLSNFEHVEQASSEVATLPLTPWDSYIIEVEKMNDPLVVSIFKQGVFKAHDTASQHIDVVFSQDLLFFKDWLDNTKKIWQPKLERFFGENCKLRADFTGASVKDKPLKLSPIKPAQASSVSNTYGAESSFANSSSVNQPNEKSFAENKTSAPTSNQPQPSQTQKQGSTPGQKQSQQYASNRPQGAGSTYGRYPRQQTNAKKEQVLTITDPEKWKKSTMILKVFPGTLTIIDEKETA